MNTLKEKFLLFRIRTHGDADAFGELYDHYVKPIYRFIYFKVSSAEHAEDLTSQTFLKAWQYVQEKREVTHFQALLYSIARSNIIDHYRATKHEHLTVTLDDEHASTVSDDAANRLRNDIDITLDATAVIARLQELKDEYREVLVMRYLDDMDTDDIAEALQKTPTNVRVLLHRATKAFTELLSTNQSHEKRNHNSSAVSS